MATLNSSQIPPPANWQDFETLCRDLWRELWSDPNAQRNGRQGQPQQGVDVFGRPGQGPDWAGVQCKLKSQITGSRLSRGEIEAEVAKARSFEPALSSFIIATTAPEDGEAQEVARLITQAQLAEGSFPVTVKGWDDVAQDLAGYPDLLEKHYPAGTGRRKGGARRVPEEPVVSASAVAAHGPGRQPARRHSALGGLHRARRHRSRAGGWSRWDW